MSDFTPSPEQAEIVTHAPESLRVVAGAGTGKTTTIVLRIAHLVDSGLDPTRILGVTFTNKATSELRERVVAALDDGLGERVPEIATYHGFAASILDEFGVLGGHRRSSLLMDDGHRSELADRVLRGVDSDDLDMTAIWTRRKDLLRLTSSITANLQSPADIIEHAPNAPDDIWRQRLALLDAARQYESDKARLGLIEYGDLIKHAVNTVQDVPGVAAEISTRYDAVVLDEYQDTDPAQRELLTTLFAGSVPIIAVGDTDQTIYEWRGATTENFENFPTDFPKPDGDASETLPLSINRRSDTSILRLANLVRDELPSIEGSRPLSPAPGADEGQVVTAWFNTDVTEARWIAEEIRRRSSEMIPYNEMAVLCRTRASIKPIIDEFRRVDIPFVVRSMGELLQIPEIADILAWLRILADRSDEVSLLRILHGGLYRLGLADLAALRRWCGSDRELSLMDAIEHFEDIHDLEPAAHERLSVFSDRHTRLLRIAQVATVPQLVEELSSELGVWDEVASLNQARSLTVRLNVRRFVEVATRWRPIEGSATLRAFLRYLAALDESDRSEELAAAAPPVSDAVSVLTVHAAKGLEWSDVYLPGVAEGTFPGKPRGFDTPDDKPHLLPHEFRLDAALEETESIEGLKDLLRTKHTYQEWRLAYVAVTRAAHRVVISGHAWDGSIKNAREPSELLLIAQRLDGAIQGPRENESTHNPAPEPFMEAVPAPDPLFPEGSATAVIANVEDPDRIRLDHPDLWDAVEERVEQLYLAIADLAAPSTEAPPRPFSVSVTNLVALARCARKFNWIHHERLPQKPRRSAQEGTAFHRRVELHHLGVIALDDAIPAAYDSPATHHEDEKPAVRSPWELFEDSRFATETPIHVETPFEITCADGTIRGKIDAIYEPEPGHWEIVDYKSGRHRDDPARAVQLEAYAVAAADGAIAGPRPERMSVTFAYFGGGSLTESSRVVDTEWLEQARRHVSDLMVVGEQGPFEPTPASDCRWCDFLHLCPAGQEATGAES